MRTREQELARKREDRRRWLERKKAGGLCVGCGGVPPEPGRRRCRSCLDRECAWAKRERARRLAAGVCTDCGRAPPMAGSRCEPCQGRMRDAQRRHAERQRARRRAG